MREVAAITRRGVTINTFMIDDAPELVGFVERMTEVNRGRAFFTAPEHLGSFLLVDYVVSRRLRRR
jgi:Ca-activated chloride channel family protein